MYDKQVPAKFTATALKKWDVAAQVEVNGIEMWIPARPLPFVSWRSLFVRLKLAWFVFIGRYDALDWSAQAAFDSSERKQTRIKVVDEEANRPTPPPGHRYLNDFYDHYVKSGKASTDFLILGQWELYDLYAIRQHGLWSLGARWSDYGPDYQSCTATHLIERYLVNNESIDIELCTFHAMLELLKSDVPIPVLTGDWNEPLNDIVYSDPCHWTHYIPWDLKQIWSIVSDKDKKFLASQYDVLASIQRGLLFKDIGKGNEHVQTN